MSLWAIRRLNLQPMDDGGRRDQVVSTDLECSGNDRGHRFWRRPLGTLIERSERLLRAPGETRTPNLLIRSEML